MRIVRPRTMESTEAILAASKAVRRKQGRQSREVFILMLFLGHSRATVRAKLLRAGFPKFMRFTVPAVRTYTETDGASCQGTAHAPLSLSPTLSLALSRSSALSLSRRTRSISSWHLFASFLFSFLGLFMNLNIVIEKIKQRICRRNKYLVIVHYIKNI